ncbi:MAG: hypothetical protein ACXWRA_08795 [Pseudobdellovibrionaceae bacterium]
MVNNNFFSKFAFLFLLNIVPLQKAFSNQCATRSHNIGFYGFDNDRPDSGPSALEMVLKYCKANKLSDSRECAINARCGYNFPGHPYSSGQAVCITERGGVRFRSMKIHFYINQIVGDLLNECHQADAGNSYECDRNLFCIDSNFEKYLKR